VYNVIVATSVGEEGIDIGEVDLIVLFDSTSSGIRNVQRMGRTGRKRNGRIVVLTTDNREYNKFKKGTNSTNEMSTFLKFE
jgi:ATP-dependent DNA helicase MPH1